MKYYVGRFWNLIDFIFLVGICIAMLLGGKIAPLLILVGVLPIPFLTSRIRTLDFSIWPLALPFGLYFSYCLSTFLLFKGIDDTTSPPVNPSLEFYLVAIAMTFVGFLRGLQVQNLAWMFRQFIPWILVGCFAVLTYLMLAEIRVGCRVQGMAPWPFIPALLFSTLSFLSLLGWEKLGAKDRWLRLAVLGFGVVVTTTYTGSRGVAIGQACAFVCLALASLLPRFRQSLPQWKHLVCAVAGGIIISVAVGAVTGCGPVNRFSSTFSAIKTMVSNSASIVFQSTAEEASSGDRGQVPTQEINPSRVEAAPPAIAEASKDPSINIRLDMWKVSLEAIGEKPFLGHGSLYLQELIGRSFGFEHNHNQYLSWLVTGGIIQLCLGLFFLATPLFVSGRLELADRVICTVSISILWGAAMFFDSYFNLKFYTHYFCLLCGFLFALSIETAKEGSA